MAHSIHGLACMLTRTATLKSGFLSRILGFFWYSVMRLTLRIDAMILHAPMRHLSATTLISALPTAWRREEVDVSAALYESVRPFNRHHQRFDIPSSLIGAARCPAVGLIVRRLSLPCALVMFGSLSAPSRSIKDPTLCWSGSSFVASFHVSTKQSPWLLVPVFGPS